MAVCPTLSELDNYVRTNKWYALGLQLGIEDKELETIQKHRGGDKDECRRAMFRIWLGTTSRKELLNALRTKAVNELVIANEYEKLIITTSHSDILHTQVEVPPSLPSKEPKWHDDGVARYKISEKYRPEFDEKRGELCILISKVTKIVKNQPVSLDDLKYFLSLFRRDAETAESLNDAMKVVCNYTSLTNTKLLEAVAKEFNLHVRGAIYLIEQFNGSIERFCRNIQTQHIYGQDFMEQSCKNLLKSDLEEVQFVLEWEGDNTTLRDIQGVLRKAFHDNARHVMVKVVNEGNGSYIRQSKSTPAFIPFKEIEVKPIQKEIFDKFSQVEKLQTLLKIKVKELTSLQEQDKTSQVEQLQTLLKMKTKELESQQEQIESLQTIVISKNEQVEELQSKLEKKDEIVKELESIQEQVKPLQTEIFYKTSQVEELQTLLEIKTKELESLQEQVKSLQTTVVDKTSQTDELQNAVENNEVHLKELQMQRERIRELEVTIQEMKQLEETRKTSSLVPQRSSDIISIPDDPDLHIAKQKVFHIKGNTLDWGDYGFKMYFPEGTIPPSKVLIKALVGGKFQFPDGMELVSALYVISFPEEYLQPVKLQIQHCVNLKSSRQFKYLSFITAPIDESVPPYKFQFIEGGKFYTDRQYGMIVRSKFCIMATGIGKKTNGHDPHISSDTDNEIQSTSEHDDVQNDVSNTDSSDDKDTSSDTDSKTQSKSGHVDIPSTDNTEEPPTDGETPPSSTNIDVPSTGNVEKDKDSSNDTDCETQTHHSILKGVQVPNDSGVPDNIYTGGIYYERTGCNIWEMTFMVVQNVKVFLEYIKENHHSPEKDEMIRFSFLNPVSGFIELDSVSMEQVVYRGWSIEPHKEPLRLTKRDADLFGSNDLPIPASCLVTVWADLSCNPNIRLRHPVTLTGIDSNTRKIYISRFLETSTTESTRDQVQDSNTTNHPITTPHTGSDRSCVDTSQVVKCIELVMEKNHAKLTRLFKTGSLKTVADELLEAGIITRDVQTNPTSDYIINCFLSGFVFKDELEEIEEYCMKFFNAFYEILGPYVDAANKIKKSIQESVRDKLGIQLNM